jgi:hypothetical protein
MKIHREANPNLILQKVRSTLDGLDTEVKSECSKFSEDVKYWAEFQTGIKVSIYYISVYFFQSFVSKSVQIFEVSIKSFFF